jgi:hypothetical protein
MQEGGALPLLNSKRNNLNKYHLASNLKMMNEKYDNNLKRN